MAKAELEAFAASSGITYAAVFVPQSKSRNAKPIKTPGDLSLNWRVTLTRNGRTLTTDYMQGLGHAPGYKQGRVSVDQFTALKQTAETGKAHSVGHLYYGAPALPAPPVIDVLWSLALDASVLDAGSFEEWARDYGYDTDSREAERIYQACIKIALELRALLGHDALRQLQEAGQDY